jgi:hypothetical protein
MPQVSRRSSVMSLQYRAEWPLWILPLGHGRGRIGIAG